MKISRSQLISLKLSSPQHAQSDERFMGEETRCDRRCDETSPFFNNCYRLAILAERSSGPGHPAIPAAQSSKQVLSKQVPLAHNVQMLSRAIAVALMIVRSTSNDDSGSEILRSSYCYDSSYSMVVEL